VSPIISCQNISKAYAGRFLFQDISFSVEEDEKVGLIGPNGSGKSTLLKILAGHTGPDEGSIVKRRDLRVAYLPQYHSFDREKSAQEIVLEGLREDTHLESEQKLSKAQAMLSRLGFSEPDIKVSTLSGGWIKRLALALELVKEPELLLLDEPTNHLDLAGVLF
jgi:ATPase components of ABC transporters with duplicated ATPase domains